MMRERMAATPPIRSVIGDIVFGLASLILVASRLIFTGPIHAKIVYHFIQYRIF